MRYLHIKNISWTKLEYPLMLAPLPCGNIIKGMDGLEYVGKYVLDKWDEPSLPYYERRLRIQTTSILPVKTVSSKEEILTEHHNLMKDWEGLKGSLILNPYGLYYNTTKVNTNRIFIPGNGSDYGTIIEIDRDHVVIDNRNFGQLKVQKSKLKSHISKKDMYTTIDFTYGYSYSGIEILEATKR